LVGQVLDTGWLGYLRVDYRKGDNIDGWGVNGGLRYQWQDAERLLLACARGFPRPIYGQFSAMYA